VNHAADIAVSDGQAVFEVPCRVVPGVGVTRHFFAAPRPDAHAFRVHRFVGQMGQQPAHGRGSFFQIYDEFLRLCVQ
jgi:hypothetical protein